MANVYAVASGNWSSTATWNTGALPTAADDVFSNGFTVTINGTFTVLSIRNTALGSPVIAAGGFFTFANGGNLNCTATPAIQTGLSVITTPLQMTLGAGNVATFTGSVETSVVNSGTSTIITIILLSGGGTLNLIGNYNADGSTTNSAGNKILISQTNGTLNITGNLNNTSNSAGSQSSRTLTVTGGTLSITGNVVSTTTGLIGGSSQTIIANTSTVNVNGNVTNLGTKTAIGIAGGELNVTGNVTGGQLAAIDSTSATKISITGDVTGTINGAINSTGITSITGNVSASAAVYAVYNTGTTIINGTITNASNGRMAIWSARLFIGSTPTSMTLYTIGSLTPKVLYSQDAFPNAPSASNVRQGITYGVGGTLLGTLSMPSPSDVRAGVATDATIGTANLTTSDIFSAISAATTGVGKRLANVATIDSDGAIIAAFKP